MGRATPGEGSKGQIPRHEKGAVAEREAGPGRSQESWGKMNICSSPWATQAETLVGSLDGDEPGGV